MKRAPARRRVDPVSSIHRIDPRPCVMTFPDVGLTYTRAQAGRSGGTGHRCRIDPRSGHYKA